MASTVFGSIVIQNANQLGDVTRRELLAAEAITPGELLEIASATTVGPHSGAAGFLQGKLVALESQTPDHDTNPSIDEDYDIGDTVYYAEGKPGDIFYMFLAAQETTVMNPPSPLVSDGAGALTVAVVGAGTLEGSVVGVANEVVAAGGARARIQVRIT